MACYHPLTAYARTRKNGKRAIVFADDHVRPWIIKDGYLFEEKLLIPCGQCLGCRIDYSREWAIRCMLEASLYDNETNPGKNYFLTLTYHDDFLPAGKLLRPSLKPDDLTKFMKDLRRQLEYHFNWQGVRFYACGEYGEKFKRPHFHIILFNMPKLPLKYYRTNFEGNILYNCDFISKVWGKGHAVIGEVNFHTCAYVARYMTKKHKGEESDYYENEGIEPEFSRCSRRPGIGYQYYEEHKDRFYLSDEISVPKGDGTVLKVHPPEFYDRLYDIDSPDDMRSIKDKRKEAAENSLNQELSRTSLSREEYLSMKESNFIARVKRLKRPEF